MKNIWLLSVIALVLSGTFLVSATSCGSRRAKAVDTLKVNTTGLCDDIIGFNGPTPVEISIVDGVVTGIKALPNQETPRFFQRVLDGGLLEKLNGLTVEEARQTELDAVTGATFSSNALIGNIRRGLDSLQVR